MSAAITETLPLNFVQAIALARVAEVMFINRLLELEPQWRAALRNQQPQAQRLLYALRRAVSGLTQLSDFADAINELGNTGGCDYQALGEVFIARLEPAGEEPEANAARNQWQQVFRLLAEMQQSLTPAA
ncbi:MAG TPA: hypothetical protein VKA60_15595 [Blastocatellia bacterium]|nr:hypothetical protein [Blastocatellia bacterium]